MVKLITLFVVLLIVLFPVKQTTGQTNTSSNKNDAYALDDDADIPPFAKNLIDKENYLKLRQDFINQRRGIPYNLTYNPRLKAVEDVRRMSLNKTGPGLLVQSANWTFLGPSPIPNGQTSSFTAAVSGRVTCIAIHPSNANIVYVGTAQGGVFRSLDGGTTWTAIFDDALSLAIGSLALAPSDPTILYVGTGEANFSADSFFGVGIYRINNADTSPVLTGPINPSMTMTINNVSQSVKPFFNKSISKIVVHPTNPAIIFVSTTSAIGGKVDALAPFVCPRGIFFSSNATSSLGLITFTKLTVNTEASTDNPPTGDCDITDIVVEPGNPNNLLCFLCGSTSSCGVYRSTNALAGSPAFTRTFTSGLSYDVGKFDIVKIGSVVTVLLGTGETSTICSGTSGIMRKSTDGGVTWSSELSGFGGFCGGQCWYDIAIAVDPTNAQNILVGGSASGTCTVVYKRSTDGGTTASATDGGLHADNHALAIAPSNHNIVYCGTDGGIFKSTDNGATWKSLNNSGFSATQFQSLALHPTDANFMLGGTQDNGTIYRRGNGTWTRADWGDGGYALIDQNATDTSTVTIYHTYFNIINSLIGFARITSSANAKDGSWASYGCGLGAANGISCTASAVMFYAPMALGGGNPNILYFGSDVLYRSSNKGVTMTKVSQEPIASGWAISSISVSKINDDVRLIGLTNGTVWATTTGSSTLVNITPAGSPAAPVGSVFIDPLNASTAYLCYGGFGISGGKHIYKTTNLAGGASAWVAVGSSLPDVPVSTLTVDRSNTNLVYVGTDIGVFVSTNAGSSWTAFNTGLPVVAVFDIGISPVTGALRISTHGRGIWENTNSPLPVNLTAFNVIPQKFGSVLLEWYTATEQNNIGFDIERAAVNNNNSDLNWNKIGFINGLGNSSVPHKYDYIDKSPAGGYKFIYRLKQINENGQILYYDQKEVTISINDFGLYQNYPNPFNPNTIIKYQLPFDSNVKIKLFNNLGEEVKTLIDEFSQAGIYELQLNASALASGVYYYRLESGSFTDTKKLIVLK